MQIRKGAYYRTRDGDVVGPMRKRDGMTTYPWGAGADCWTDSGRFGEDVENCDMDLISEVYVSDTPPDAPLPDIITDQPCKTLRDEFAMTLMKADDFMVGFKEHAEQLYRAADAMMEARKKGGSHD